MMIYSCNTNNSFWFSVIYFAGFLLKSQFIRLLLKKVVLKKSSYSGQNQKVKCWYDL